MLPTMPELPEVETVRRALENVLTGRRVRSVQGQTIQMRRPLRPEVIARAVSGRTIERFRRRAKYLLIDIGPPGHGSLLVHLGMSGRLSLRSPEDPREPHTHLTLTFEDDTELRFIDPRRFGLADWLEPGAEARDPSLTRLGVEPLDQELPRILPSLFKARRSPVKTLLLNQALVVGVGNIYATEALWRAGIRPDRSGIRTSAPRLEQLAHDLKDVLSEAIECGGTTLRDFSSPAGELGYFAIELDVYGKQGSPCPRCDAPLKNMILGGRSTAWCQRCQR